MEWSIGHVLSVEDRLSKVMNNDFQIALENAWWDKLMTERPSKGRKEDIEFLLTTADIHKLDRGQMAYDDLVKSFFELLNEDFGTGLKVSRNQFEDDELGFAADWAAQAGAAMALAPQYQAVNLINGGETNKGYDGVNFFADTHPVNPYDTGKGTYSNLITGNALADADGHAVFAAYNRAEAKMRGYKMPNGRNRNLSPTYLVVGPSLKLAALEISQARFISATENVLGRDVQFNGKVHAGVDVIVINELADLDDGGSWFLAAANGGSALLPFIYGLRRPYDMNSYTGLTQAELNIRNELEWQIRGRNAAIYGHPYQMVKSKV